MCFSQAIRELQLLGLLQPARRCHGEHARSGVASGHTTSMRDCCYSVMLMHRAIDERLMHAHLSSIYGKDDALP